MNHALQEQFVVCGGGRPVSASKPAGAGKPKFFPNLVSFEKFSGVEESDPTAKRLVIEFGGVGDDCGSREIALRRAFIIAERICRRASPLPS